MQQQSPVSSPEGLFRNDKPQDPVPGSTNNNSFDHADGAGAGGIVLDIQVEQQIVRNVLLSVFNPQMTSTLMQGFYANPAGANELQFYDSKPNSESSPPPGGPPPSRTKNETSDNNHNFIGGQKHMSLPLSDIEGGVGSPEPNTTTAHDSRIWCRFQVDGFTLSHFAKDVFPLFYVSLVQLNGEPLPRIVEDGVAKPMADMRLRISIRNKWTEVSTEVLPDTEFVRTLRDGKLEVNDLVFQDVTLKHGGYFVMHISALDYSEEVLEWKSDKFVIQSVKTHCNKRRKLTGGSRSRKSKNPANSSNNNHSGTGSHARAASPDSETYFPPLPKHATISAAATTSIAPRMHRDDISAIKNPSYAHQNSLYIPQQPLPRHTTTTANNNNNTTTYNNQHHNTHPQHLAHHHYSPLPSNNNNNNNNNNAMGLVGVQSNISIPSVQMPSLSHPRTHSNHFTTAHQHPPPNNNTHSPILPDHVHSSNLPIPASVSASLGSLPRLQSNVSGSMCVGPNRDPFMRT